ncbi:BTAD domain-containing putative transcriptional regulator [Mesorhizobium sp.]|uniref:BTAD domain-containing putative transcriptional regulator n=1 Tax=Mesorhizobium sp. TaxID=1871066 RepID=UPI000FE46BC8|nr:BTAD domain-containing putative transcriptional regulator [Mesorhizobium sp.]RWO81003.1 MAG: hypothetical protein EOQ95_28655 [Mesorhizobium sp.]RWQ53890.1 MAG: hypothetical protein EOS84_13960 [Mesorhizobium sp.]
MGVALQLFGGFRAVRDDGQVIPMPDRSRALLAHLALAATPIQRTVLAAVLSPDECEPDQGRNLRQALYAIRKALGHEAIVCTDHSALSLDHAIVRADICEFRRAIAGSGEKSLLRAIELYQGAFLQGETFRSPDFEDWLRARRGELLEEVVNALLRVTRLEADRGTFDGALSHARRALELDTLCEEAHRQVIWCLAALGQRSNALRHYEVARQLFADELGVDLEAETARLRSVVGEGNIDVLQGRRGHLTDGSDVLRPHDDQHEPASSTPPARKRIRAAVIAIGFAACGAAAMVSLAMSQWPAARLPPPETLPSIAVLPFESSGGEKAEEVIGYGIAEELTAMLASHPGISVLSPSRAARIGPDADPSDVSKQWGVRYVLNGSVRRSGQVLKLIVRLTDTQTGFQVWSTQLEGDDKSSAELRIAEIIDETLIGFSGAIGKEEQRQAWGKSDRDLLEQDYVRRGEQFSLKFNPEAHSKALQVWHEGLARFPNSVRLKLSLAFIYRYAAEAGNGDRVRNLETACTLGREVETAPRKSRYEEWLSHWLSAKLAQWCEDDFPRSINEIEVAIDMAPYDASARADLAELLANAGKIETAIEWLQEAIRRDPRPPDWYHRNLAWAHYLDGRDDMALQALQSQRNLQPNPLLAVVYARLNRDAEAQEALVAYRRLNPSFESANEVQRPLTSTLRKKWIGDLASLGMN